MTQAIAHCNRPWWKRPPTWFIVIGALLILVFAAVEMDSQGTGDALRRISRSA